jgi:tetratricopeptide (TPR) repeat protein
METRDLKAIGRSLMEARRTTDAIAVFEKVRRREPRDVYALDVLGFLYYSAERFNEARQCCEASIALQADNHYAHKGLGLCLVKLGRVDEGLAALERSIALKPDYFDSRHDLGVTLLDLGRYDEARACFECCLELDPARAPAVHRALARIDEAQGAS